MPRVRRRRALHAAVKHDGSSIESRPSRQNPRLHILCVEPMPVTYVFLRWNLLANSVPRLTEEAFGRPAQGGVGGVLALQSAVTADGRPVTVDYSPVMSGFGVTSASAQSGTIGSFRLPVTRAGHAAATTRATVGSLELEAYLQARGVRRLRMLKMDCEGCEFTLARDVMARGRAPHTSVSSHSAHSAFTVRGVHTDS